MNKRDLMKISRRLVKIGDLALEIHLLLDKEYKEVRK